MKKLAYLVSHPIQYQAPMLRHIAAAPGVQLKVFFLSDFSVRGYADPGFGQAVEWDVPLLDGYDHEFLPALGSTDQLTFIKPLVHGLGKRLQDGGFDALWLHGYSHVSHLAAIAAAKRLGVKVLMRGESNLISAPRGPVKTMVKERFLRMLLAQCDACLPIGSLNHAYYRHYGVPEERLFAVPYAVDNAFFQERARQAAPEREAFRASLGLAPGRPVILYASKLQGRKHPIDLLEAYISLSPDGTEPHPYLVYVGSGEETESLEARARATGWDSIKFCGFQNQTRLPAFFDLADVFVLASTYEPWGLIVNEVMNAARPVIVSDQVGCAPDLVTSGENGHVIPARDVTALARALQDVLGTPGRAAEMGQKALARIDRWGFAEDLAGLEAALAAVVPPHHVRH